MPHISTYGGTYLKDELTGARRSIVHEDRDANGRDLDVNDMAITSNLGANSGPGGTSFMTGVGLPTDNIGGNSGPGGSSF